MLPPHPPSPDVAFRRRAVALFALVAVAGTVLFWTSLAGGEGGGEAVGPAVRAELGAALGRAPESEPVSVVLEKRPWGAVELLGRVTDEAGTGIEQASVQVALLCRGAARPIARLATDVDGRFQVRALEVAELSPLERANARVVVQAWKRGYALGQQIADVQESARQLSVDIALAAQGGSASGRVLGPDGLPVAGARLRLVPLAFEEEARVEPWEVETDSEGCFRIALSGGTFFDLEAWADEVGYAALRGLQLDPERHVDLGAVVLEEHGVIEGIVRQPDGAPAEALRLRAQRVPEPGVPADVDGARVARARTRADGSFRLAGLAAGQYVLEYVEPGAEAPATAEPVASGTRDLELVFHGHRVLVRVVQEGGAGLPGTTVSCHPLRERSDGSFAPAFAGWGSFQVAHAEGPSAIASFVVEPGARYAVRASVAGGRTSEALVDVPPERHAAYAQLVLAPSGPEGRLEVHLADPLGRVLSPLRVALTSPHTGLLLEGGHVTSDEPFLLVPHGRYRVVVELLDDDPLAPEFWLPATVDEPLSIDPALPARLDLVAREGGRLAIRFGSSTPEPRGPRAIRVRAQPLGGGDGIPIEFYVYGPDWTLDHGALRYGEENLSRTVLAPGDYRVRIDGPELESLELPARVAPRRVTEVAVPL